MKKIACNKNYRLLRIAKDRQPWEIAPSDIHGNGVIAIKKIPKGFMLGMVAEILDQELMKDELGSFLNHCPNSNCELLEDFDKKYWCYTIKDIDIGDEICIDYRGVPSPPFSRDVSRFT